MADVDTANPRAAIEQPATNPNSELPRASKEISLKKEAAAEQNGGYSKWIWYIFDRYKIESKIAHKTRVNRSLSKRCFGQEEVEKYETNNFYRNYLFGCSVGESCYLLVLILLFLSESHEKFDLFRDRRTVFDNSLILFSGVVASCAIRFLAYSYLNAHLVVAFQAIALAVTFVGAYEFSCLRPYFVRPPVTASGHGALFLISITENILNYDPDRLQTLLYDLKCDQSFVRLNTVSLLSDIIGLFISIRISML